VESVAGAAASPIAYGDVSAHVRSLTAGGIPFVFLLGLALNLAPQVL